MGKKFTGIKVHKSILDDPEWLGEKFSKPLAWIDLQLLADDSGLVRASFRSLSRRWKWSPNRVSRFISFLISYGKAELNHGTFHGTLTEHVIVIKSVDYKGDGTFTERSVEQIGEKGPLAPNLPLSSLSPAPLFSTTPTYPLLSPEKEESTAHTRVYERPREEAPPPTPSPGIDLPFKSERFVRTWNLLVGQPKWKNKSKAALQMSAKKLAAFDEDFAIGLMEDAIANGWQGVVFSDTAEKYRKSRSRDETSLENQNISAIWGRT